MKTFLLRTTKTEQIYKNVFFPIMEICFYQTIARLFHLEWERLYGQIKYDKHDGL